MKILKKYYTVGGSYQGINILSFKILKFKFKWFTDCGSWFIYMYFGKSFIRFSDCGTYISKLR